MRSPLLLVAEREVRAYVATLSFWIALAVGPLAIGGALGLATLAAKPSQPALVAVEAPNPELERSAEAAVLEAARLDGRPVQLTSAAAGVAVVQVSQSNGVGEVRFLGPAPLSPSARELVARTLERDELARQAAAPRAAFRAVAPASSAADGHAIARFCVVMMLWLTLTGSLGMLLQAIVRERASKALEGLLAAASPADIVHGKLVGVGAVSALVVGAWLASAAALAPLAPRGAGLGAATLSELGDGAGLVRAGLVYLLAFAFYGLLTLALGARARDTAQAQNLSRPMFAVLVAAFFVALATAAGAGGALSWLVYLPPFTPFMLLLAAPGSLSVASQAIAICILAASALICGRWATGALMLGSAARRRRRA